jgi:very-short-patch-repair endonuclease
MDARLTGSVNRHRFHKHFLRNVKDKNENDLHRAINNFYLNSYHYCQQHILQMFFVLFYYQTVIANKVSSA